MLNTQSLLDVEDWGFILALLKKHGCLLEIGIAHMAKNKEIPGIKSVKDALEDLESELTIVKSILSKLNVDEEKVIPKAKF